MSTTISEIPAGSGHYHSRTETPEERKETATAAYKAFAKAKIDPVRCRVQFYGDRALVTFQEGQFNGRKVWV